MSRRGFLGIGGTALVVASSGAGVLGLAGCDGSGSGPSGDPGSAARMWSMWSEGEPNEAILAEAVKDFKKEVGIDIGVDWKGRQPVDALLPSLNTSNVPTDLLNGGNTEIVNKLAATENAVDLSDVYDRQVPGEDVTVAEAVGNGNRIANSIGFTEEGIPVAVPYQLSTFLFFYNGRRFPDLQDNPPRDWDEFFMMLDEQVAKGRQPIALDGSKPPYHAWYSQHLVSSIVGYSGWVDAHLDRSGQLWREPEYVEAARIIERLASGGYFIDGYDASQFPAMQQKWSNNESDFIFNGTWLPKEVKPYGDPEAEYRSFPFPAVPGYEPPPVFIATQGVSVLSKAEDVELAKEFVSWMLKTKYQEMTATEAGEIPVRVDVAVPPTAEGAVEQLSGGKLIQSAPPNQAYWNDVFEVVHADLVFGRLTAEEYIDKLATQSNEFWKNHE